MDPTAYEGWYHTPRGRWIGRQELALLLRLLRPVRGATLLDVGCGSGWFSRGFAGAGLQVVGMDPDAAMIACARGQGGAVDYLQGDALQLPFADDSFDYCAAVTSLCFVRRPAQALAEMWRVSRRGVVLGLLNRHSLLYRRKRGRGAYRGARWDTRAGVRSWLAPLEPAPRKQRWGTAVLLPSGSAGARLAEWLFHGRLPWGAFLAVYLGKQDR
ncbi:MAG TPA: class I SAM-dependent methyltransferase [Gammaproteobacteria bacterium]|nr:class I SAM-dependent methyltransferase [Gammaproteobacteria bacterium]